MAGANRWILGIACSLAACGPAPYVELQIADERLPFLRDGIDFDGLGVEARAEGCGNAVVGYPHQPLPATLSVVPGDCFQSSFQLQASATLGERRVAESRWLALQFPDSGPAVATATLADLAGPRLRFRTGFEPGDPPLNDQLIVVVAQGVDGLNARIDTTLATQGSRAVHLTGTATTTAAAALVRVAALDLLIAPRDRLAFAMRADGALLTEGVDLQLDSGATAKSLMLVDQSDTPIDPSSAAGRSAGTWQRYLVDLSAAQGARLVGILFGFDARMGGSTGPFELRLDDLSVESP